MSVTQRLPSDLDVITVCDSYRNAVELSESRIGQLAAGNPAFYLRMRNGGGCTIKLYRRVLQWFSDNWPAHLEWPPDVPRPAPASETKEAA